MIGQKSKSPAEGRMSILSKMIGASKYLALMEICDMQNLDVVLSYPYCKSTAMALSSEKVRRGSRETGTRILEIFLWRTKRTTIKPI